LVGKTLTIPSTVLTGAFRLPSFHKNEFLGSKWMVTDEEVKKQLQIG
jgi:hypothetical protein